MDPGSWSRNNRKVEEVEPDPTLLHLMFITTAQDKSRSRIDRIHVRLTPYNANANDFFVANDKLATLD